MNGKTPTEILAAAGTDSAPDEAGRLRALSEKWRKKAVQSEKASAALRQQVGDLMDRIERTEAERADLGKHHAAEIAALEARLEQATRTERNFAALSRRSDEMLELLQQSLRGRGWSQRILPLRLVRRVVEAIWLWPWMGGIFDAGHYRKARPAAAAWMPDLAHFLLIGRGRGLSPTPLFDPAYYRRRNSDVLLAGTDPLLHYMRHGGREGRKPSPGFDGAYYLHQNSDVVRKGANPLRHYLRHGWREGRDPNSLFDVSFYRDETGCAGEPLQHYLTSGRVEGRRPGPAFDPARYLADNPDVLALGMDPLLHYLEDGVAEGRALPAGRIDIRPRTDGIRILLVSHGLGGGTGHHCRDMESLLEREGVDVWMLESAADGIYRLSSARRGVSATHDVTAPKDEADLLIDLRKLAPDLVHVHHVIGFGRRLERWLAELGAPYDVTLHDYTAICPRVTLIDGSHRHCQEPADTRECDRCVASDGPYPYLQRDYEAAGDTARWRRIFYDFLAGARMRFVPDQDVAERLVRHFSSLSFVVRPHPESVSPIPARPPAGGLRVRVAIIGGIGVEKGFHRLAACARAAHKQRVPLTFVVIGDVCNPAGLAGLSSVELSGRYRREELPGLIDRAGCHLALFLSPWPETYMYTVSEALRAGLYPVSLDLGAPARRLRELGWGAVIPTEMSPEEINQRLLSLAVDHPLPSSDLRIGKVYPSMIEDYYVFKRR